MPSPWVGTTIQDVSNPQRQNSKDPLIAFLSLLDLPMVGYNEDLQKLFETLKTSGRFDRMPTLALKAVALKFADSLDWFCMDGCPDCLTPWGTRLMYLATLFHTDNTPEMALVDEEDVRALMARAQALSGRFEEPKKYISDEMENEGSRKVTSQEDFETSRFHQVLGSILNALCVHESWEAATVYFFEASYLRWNQTDLDTEEFLVDDKLDEVIGFFSLENTLEHTADWEPSRSKELLTFMVSALNSNNGSHKSKEIIMYLHKMGSVCPTILISDTVHGLAFNKHGRLETNLEMAKELLELLPVDAPKYEALKAKINGPSV